MKGTIGNVGEGFVCLYLDGENDAEKSFLEMLVHGRLNEYEMVRNAADSYTLCITEPPQKTRKVAKRRATALAQKPGK